MNTLPSIENDFPAWYAEVVRRAGLAENAAVRGMMVIKPYGYAIWELLQRQMDDRIKATGHENFYFPMLIPASVLAKEADLVEGFAPEVAVVTEAGGSKLEEPLVLRPTSEAAIWSTYGRWLQSYRDLPMLYNQWANVVRWELRPRLFLRTSEFLWQEGHTAHETEQEAVAECLRILHEVYADTQRSVLAMPALLGRKSAAERFPGARETFTTEAMMGDRKALQAATSHYLGDEFARAYGVTYTGRDGSEHHPYATSWGSTTRLVGAVIMMHGDERGLRLPPAVAPHQVVVIPIQPGEASVLEQAHALAAELRAAGIRVKLDDRDHVRPGAKFFEWELKGAPIRVELGERELARGEVSRGPPRPRAARAAVPRPAGRTAARDAGRDPPGAVRPRRRAPGRQHAGASTIAPTLIEYLQAGSGFAVTAWCGSPECEAAVKAETSATLRCLALEPEDPGAPCAVCGRPGVETATWGQAY